ncbi:molybdopterin converting factor subunit 1 [Pontibacter litorisediminis]|uniref:molybdopterin converting factor subunit 1 n=1 Tax=Pontibacter litorisediminis TaxID=1846260 RepID=UPI0023EAA9D7|nr:molybdopterin converting factor subunit 1 [Pontibacter litorisediminis]
MKVNVLAFGIAKEIVGGSSVAVELPGEATVANLRAELEEQYPRLKQLASYMVAVNDTYTTPGDTVQQHDEIALIPPVSGG